MDHKDYQDSGDEEEEAPYTRPKNITFIFKTDPGNGQWTMSKKNGPVNINEEKDDDKEEDDKEEDDKEDNKDDDENNDEEDTDDNEDEDEEVTSEDEVLDIPILNPAHLTLLRHRSLKAGNLFDGWVEERGEVGETPDENGEDENEILSELDMNVYDCGCEEEREEKEECDGEDERESDGEDEDDVGVNVECVNVLSELKSILVPECKKRKREEDESYKPKKKLRFSF